MGQEKHILEYVENAELFFTHFLKQKGTLETFAKMVVLKNMEKEDTILAKIVKRKFIEKIGIGKL